MTKPRKLSRKAQHAKLLRDNRHRYLPMLRAQGGGCAICGRKPSERRRLDMDHNHRTMTIRGLLCHRCNRSLPEWITPAWLRKAAEYLEKEDS